jgi:hypothetical protein
MIKKLKDCHEKTSQKGHPCLEEDLKGSLAGLYKRGLIDTRMEDINGKKLLCMYVTNAGTDYLKGLEN